MMKFKSVLASFFLAALLHAPAFAQGVGQLGSHQFWGNPGTSPSRGAPLTMGGDCTLGNNGAITCTKTNGTSFGTFATQNSATPPAIGNTTPNTGAFSALTLSGITGSTQCLQVNSSGAVSGVGGGCGAAGSSLLTGAALAKTAAYTVVTGDCGSTITLGGTSQYQLTLNAASGYAANCGFLVTNLASETSTKTIAPNGLTAFFLYPGQTALISNVNNAWIVNFVLNRWRPTSSVTIYVRPDGSDSCDGLTNAAFVSGAGCAFQTANAAMTMVMNNMDINGQSVIVKHTCGAPPCTITVAGQLLSLTGGQGFVGGVPSYQGDCTTPSNMTLAPSTSVQADIQLTFNTEINVCGFRLAGTAAHVTYGMYISGQARINLNGLMEFNDCNNGALVNSQGQLDLNGNITVSHGLGYFISAQHGAYVENGSNITITLSGTPAWSNAFVYVNFMAAMNLTTGITFSGAATGSRYNIQYNAVVDSTNTACANLPGNSAGTLANGGLCY